MPTWPRASLPQTNYTISMRITQDLWDLLKQVGKLRGQSITQVVRDAVLDEYDLHHVMAYPQTKLKLRYSSAHRTRSPVIGPTVQKHIMLPIALVNELHQLGDERMESLASLIRNACIRQYDLMEDLIRLGEERGYKTRSER